MATKRKKPIHPDARQYCEIVRQWAKLPELQRAQELCKHDRELVYGVMEYAATEIGGMEIPEDTKRAVLDLLASVKVNERIALRDNTTALRQVESILAVLMTRHGITEIDDAEPKARYEAGDGVDIIAHGGRLILDLQEARWRYQ